MIIENLSGIKHEEKGLTTGTPIAMHQTHYPEDSFVRMHYHSSYEINICTDLLGTINVEGTTYDLSRNILIFLPPGTLHSYRIKRSRGGIRVWHIGLHLLQMINSKVIDSLFRDDSYSISSDKDEILRIENLISEMESSENFALEAAVLNILGEFYKPHQKKIRGGRENPFLRKIINWSEAHYQDSITLDDAASAVHLSRYHFSRKFKEYTGSTYMEYLNNLRLENSLRLLGKGGSVSETAGMSGFSDVSYYIKRFRLMYNQTPLEYQKSL